MIRILIIPTAICICALSISCAGRQAGTENSAAQSVPKPKSVIGSELPDDLEAYLCLELGMSSTGKIEVIGTYSLDKDCKLGRAKDEILHVIQKDLFGSRLFWECLINAKRSKLQLLYRAGEPDAFGIIKQMKKK